MATTSDPGPTQSHPDSPTPAKSQLAHGCPHPGPGGSSEEQLGPQTTETKISGNVRTQFGFGRGSGGSKLLFYLALSVQIAAKSVSCSGNLGECKFGIGSGSGTCEGDKEK
ncbi:MAG: hypothetical protein ACI845_003463 [Gammaproteobacteria bacterium]|jgi:hypothetical protein